MFGNGGGCRSRDNRSSGINDLEMAASREAGNSGLRRNSTTVTASGTCTRNGPVALQSTRLPRYPPDGQRGSQIDESGATPLLPGRIRM